MLNHGLPSIICCFIHMFSVEMGFFHKFVSNGMVAIALRSNPLQVIYPIIVASMWIFMIYLREILGVKDEGFCN